MENSKSAKMIPPCSSHCRQAACLHIQGISAGFISSLGLPFVTALYEAIAEDKNSLGFVAVPGDASDLVNQAQCGLCCGSENSEALAQTAVQMAQMPAERLKELGENGNRYYTENMALSVGVSRFEKIFEQAIAKK